MHFISELTSIEVNNTGESTLAFLARRNKEQNAALGINSI